MRSKTPACGMCRSELLTKRETFRRMTHTRKAIFLTLVTTHGVKPNDSKAEIVQNEVTADALFNS